MRLPADAGFRLFILGLSSALAGCGLVDGTPARLATTQSAPVTQGPAADYPMVLGEPFNVDGQLFTPADTMNYDSVGYAGVEPGEGVSAAHRTLPLPSYAEVTSLDSGQTILVRIERRGPMSGRNLIALSPAATAQLGSAEGTAVRVRRVNPTEAERAELRSGRSVPARIETPKSLVEVLRRKLPANGAAGLRAVVPNAAAPIAANAAEAPGLQRTPPTAAPRVVGAYPLPSLGAAPAARKPVVVTRAESTPKPARSMPARPIAETPAAKGNFVVQAAAFSSRANADRAAKALGGFVSPAGTLFRVRTGPFATKADAAAALAKVRAAGYSDARVTTAG